MARGEELDFRQVVGAVRRGKWLIAITCALGAFGALAVMERMPPAYEAAAKVLLDTRDRRIAGIPGVVGALDVDNAAVASEIALIRSEAVIGTAVDRFALDKVPAFAAPHIALHDRALRKASVLAPAIAVYLPAPNLPNMSPAAARERARDRLRAALHAAQEGRSFVIRIAVRAETPELAAAVANGVAEIYVEQQLNTKTVATDRASGLLNVRLAALKSEVATADEAVEERKAEQLAGSTHSAAIIEQQMAEINRALISARAGRAEAEARYGQIARLIEAKGRGAAADILSSPLILTLRQQQAEVKRRQAELSTRYGPKHPKMVNVQAELRDIGGGIASEVTKLVAGLENDVEVAIAREDALATSLADLEARALDQARGAVGLRQLEREADASRKIYETFLARWKETTEGAEFQAADARIISAATPPLASLGPSRPIIAGIAGIGGLMVGLAIVFLAEMMSNTIRTGTAAERLTGLPLIGRVPHLRRARDRRAVLAHLGRNPNGAFAEAMRGLRNGLALSGAGVAPRVVMLTSATPGEGKTTTCIALAHMAALAGKTVIVVDCDFRRPQVYDAISQASARGRTGPDLISHLNGDAPVEDALIPFGAAGAWALPVNRPVPQAADGLWSEAFRNCIVDLALRFDLVLLDTPPALAVSDAAAVGQVAEACLVMVQWNRTPSQAVQECIAQLRAQHVPVTGVALTQVNLKREAAYEYGGYRGGAPDYGSYFQPAR